MIFKIVLLFLSSLYPIDKPTDRMLIESSDIIVRAKIIKTEMNHDTSGCIAHLEIIDNIYSNHKHKSSISVGYNCLDFCDWPAIFKSGEKALVYIRKLKSEKYYVNALSYGVKYPTDQNYKKIKSRINDYFSCDQDYKLKINWIIKGLEEEIFIEDVKHEIRYYHGQMKRKRRNKYYLDIYQLIDKIQFGKIKNKIPKYFKGRDLSVDLLNYFYKGDKKIKTVIIDKIKYYRDSPHKHMAEKFINILNSYEATLEQKKIESFLEYKLVRNQTDEKTISLINRYLKTVE